MGWRCGSQVPAGATPPTVLRRSISTTFANWPLALPVWVASRSSSAMLPVPFGVLVRSLPVTALRSRATHCGGPAGGGGEQRYLEGAVDAGDALVDVPVGRGADARPLEREVHLVPPRADERGRVPVRVTDGLAAGGRHLLVAVEQAGQRPAAQD